MAAVNCYVTIPCDLATAYLESIMQLSAPDQVAAMQRDPVAALGRLQSIHALAAEVLQQAQWEALDGQRLCDQPDDRSGCLRDQAGCAGECGRQQIDVHRERSVDELDRVSDLPDRHDRQAGPADRGPHTVRATEQVEGDVIVYQAPPPRHPLAPLSDDLAWID